MKSRIQNLTPIYSKFQNILPDELGNNNITEELEGARNEINSMINDDLRDIKNLAISKNKAIAFNEFKPPSVFKAAFCIDGDHSQNPILFYYAHWIMSLSTLRSLAQNIIQTSRKLKSFYSNYMNNTSSQEKRIAFNDFVSAYQDFNGYLISIYHTITQYYVLFVQVSNEIDPNNNKEETLIQYNLDMDHSQLLAAIKELLLHGNIGRLVGFPLIISALEGFITRELFNTKKSSKYSNNQIIFLKKQIPSIKTIIKVIEKLNLDRSFQTSSLKGLYDWQSIVVHRDIRANDYLLWFVCEHTTLEILAAFNANLKHYRDIMLEELQTEDEIQIK